MSNVVLRRSAPSSLSGMARFKRFIRVHGWSYVFVLPSMATFVLFVLLPVLAALKISFQNYSYVPSDTWVGFANYVTALTYGNGVFLQSIGHTLFYTACTVTINILVALILASLIQGRGKFAQTFFRAAYYLPAVTSVVIIAITWRWIYNTEWGFFNYLLGLVHLGPVGWLSNPDLALQSITLSTMLTIPATGVVLFSAAIGGIPKEYYEAAQLDGAGPIRCWWNITVPLIKPTTLYLVVLYTIASFQVFEKVFLMTPAGVGNGTQVIVTQIYENAFQNFQYGVASAQAFILFLMIAAVSVVQFRFLQSDVEY